MKRGIGSKVARWLVVAALCALPAQGFSAAAANSVISTSIKPADGTTGQNLTTGSGVKTGHIQNGAVTAAKLGIICPSGQYLQFNGTTWVCSVGTAGPQGPQGVAGPQGPAGVIDNGSVTTNTIADGAVTSVKISGAIGVEKIGNHAGVKIVHKGAIDGINTFNSINAAIGSISDSTATNRYSVVVMPGIYNENVTIGNSFIDIIGQNKNATTIRGGIAVIADTSVSNLTIEDTLDMNYPISIADNAINVEIINCVIASNYSYAGIRFGSNANAAIDNVKIAFSGNSSGIWLSNVNAGNKIVMKNLLINGTGAGAGLVISSNNTSDSDITIVNSIIDSSFGVQLNYNSKISMSNVTINSPGTTPGIAVNINQGGKFYCDRCNITSPVNYALYADGATDSTAEINNSNITGSIAANFLVKAGNSKLVVPAGYGILQAKTINCYDGNYDPIR